MTVSGRAAPRYGRRSDWIIDAGLAAVAVVIQMVGTHFAGMHRHPTRAADGWAYLLLAAGPVALLFRRRYPVAVLAATWLVTMAYVGAGYTVGPIWVSIVVAFFTAVISGHRLAAQVALLAGYVVSGWPATRQPWSLPSGWPPGSSCC
jgi:hypothetical protein